MAMTESDIKIIIAAELKKQGFDKAQKATTGLDKTFKKLGVTIAAVFSAQKIIAFGKASAKAFADDEKAVNRLTNTLKNMGLAFEDPKVKKFIADLEATSGVLDDKLRPAMQGLLTTTGSVTKSQQLLGLAIDIAAQSGVDLETVTNDLAKAYVGNTKGLSKYNLGLTKTELSAKSFSEIQDILTKQFSGANAAFLDTYAGKVALLNVAYANMQEIIGKSLIDAFSRLAGDEGIASATKAMADFGQEISDVINGITILIDKLLQIPGLSLILKLLLNMKNFGILGVVGALGADERLQPKPFKTPMTISGQSDFYTKQENARKKADAAAAKRAKELAALQKKTELERKKREKEAQQLKRAVTVFDMENIQIVAAMQGQIDGEQRLRLVALLAINNDIADVAEKTASAVLAINAPALANLGVMVKAGDTTTDVINKLLEAQAKVALIDLGIKNIPKAKNPFADWIDIMAKIMTDLDSIAAKIRNMPKVGVDGNNNGNGNGNGKGNGNGNGNGNSTANNYTVPNPFNPSSNPISTNTIANQIATLTTLRANTDSGTAINFLLKEHIDTLANSLTLSSMSNLSDEQARLRAMGYFDTPGITGSSAFDPSGFRRRDESGAPITVIVQGSVIKESDLAGIITNQIYEQQKAGQNITISSTSI